jgi:hypothetical protein
VQQVEDARQARSMRTVHALREDGMRVAGRVRTEVWLDRLADDGLISPTERASFAADQGTEQLARQLRAVELAGHDPEATLRTVLEGRGLDGARSVAQVTQHRIDVLFEDEGMAPRLELATAPPVDVPAEWLDYLQELGDVADERRYELGMEVAEQQPEWAVEALGQVPADTIARAEWEHRAGQVAAYRELGDAEDDQGVIGAAPGIARPEKRAAWYEAWQALGRPEAGADERQMSEGALRNRVRAWDREREWRPPHVDAELRATAQQAARHRQDAALLEAQAAASTDPVEAEQLREQARGKATLAELLAHTEADLSAAAETRAAWRVETATTRLAAERALAELGDRGVAVGDEPDRVTAEEWLAAHEEAMRTEDEHRQVTEDDVAPSIEAQVTAEDAAVQREQGTRAEPAVDGRENDAAPVAEHEDQAAEAQPAPDATAEQQMPAGVPVRADVEATVVAARLAADELADRRSLEQAHAQEAAEQDQREAAWRAADERSAAAEREAGMSL